MNLSELVRYRKELIREHASKLDAIDVLLGKRPPAEPLIQRDGKRAKGQMSRWIKEALNEVPPLFTVHHVLSAIQSKHASENVRRWDVNHALWRMEKAGEFSEPESHRGKRPKVYEKKEKRDVTGPNT